MSRCGLADTASLLSDAIIGAERLARIVRFRGRLAAWRDLGGDSILLHLRRSLVDGQCGVGRTNGGFLALGLGVGAAGSGDGDEEGAQRRARASGDALGE